MDLEVHQAVVDAKATESGCTVHMVEEVVDGGAIVVQKRCAVLPTDTAATLKARVQPLEGACDLPERPRGSETADRIRAPPSVLEAAGSDDATGGAGGSTGWSRRLL